MFDLEKAIADWRRRMLAAGIKTPTTLEELEIHLREEIRSLISAGALEAEAFRLAVSRVGNPRLVAAEFQKAECVSDKPALIGLTFWVCAITLLAADLFSKWLGGKLGLLLVAHIFTFTAGYGAAFLAGGYGIYYVCRRWLRIVPPVPQQDLHRAMFLCSQLAAALVLIGYVLGTIWSERNQGRIFLGGPRDLSGTAATLWLIAYWSLQRFNLASSRTALLLGIAGNIVIGLAWFGPVLLAQHVGIGSSPSLDTLLVIHLLFLAAGFLPGPEKLEA